MKNLRIVAVLFLLLSLPGYGREFTNKDGKCSSVDITLKGRVGLVTQNSDFSFKCDFLRVSVNAAFADNFKFTFRQRLNKAPTADNPLAATDYLYLTWEKNGWEITGGKTYIACGGYEYLASSYDIYIRPVFYDGLGGMYNYVVQGSRIWEKEKLTLQFGTSLYSSKPSDLLGYSVLLQGRQGCWEHAFSANFFERERNRYNMFVCLGNRFHINESVIVMGLAHRMDVHNPTFFKDFSAAAKFKVPVHECVSILGKAVWDYKENGIEDPILPDGTNTWQAGGGIEYHPVRNFRNLRLHCIYYNVNGTDHCVMAGMSISLGLL